MRGTQGRGGRAVLAALALALSTPAAAAVAQDAPPAQTEDSAVSGGLEFGTGPVQETPTVEGSRARVVDGIAYAPEDAPESVKQIIWAGNRIVGKPYLFGGGHRSFEDSGYDCSGTASYALHGGGRLQRPRDSSAFFDYGAAGRGTWVTIYTSSGHMYLTVAGVRLDTSAADDAGGQKGPRWRPVRRSNAGYRVRHPVGL